MNTLIGERDKFLNSLTRERYCDYVIDRKLVEAGGLGKTVYIYPARGTNRNISCERVMELINSGKDIKFVKASDVFKKPNRSYGPYDHDLWDHLNSYVTQKLIYEELCKQEYERLLRKSIATLKPEFHKHSSFHDHPFITNWYTYGVTLPDGIIKVKHDSNLD